LDRAIAENKLTKYKYYPIIVSLSEDERAAYADYSCQIAKCLIKGKNGKLKLSEKGKKIALKRARLVAGARNKIEALEEVITPYKEDKHILVYCGATKVLDPDKESTEVDDDDLRQIDIVTDLLGNKMKMKVSQFTSNESVEERAILKKEFAAGDTLQALIAIKCLDEGVNIPSIRTAFILASTTNPKEYIQRRGRVLRLADGKDYAEIYDFITLPRPLDEVSSLTEEEMKRELTLVKNELCRAEEFVRIAMNCVSCSSVLDNIREAYDLQDYVLEFEEDFNYAD
jgi:superfamily II DNA or RNA helicase